MEINEPIIKTLIFFLNIFLSVKGKSNKPNIAIIGNLKKNQIGKYEEGKSWAFMHVPNVIVHTVWTWFLKKSNA